MDIIQEHKQGRKVYKICFPGGEEVSFRLLTWNEFNVYRDALFRKSIPQDIIEEAIYRQCSLFDSASARGPNSKAGITSTVASLIMSMSGPVEYSDFNTAMDLIRPTVDSVDSQIIMIICKAFPAYKPEEVTAMPWGTVLQRLAQAERILMSQNPPALAEPIKLLPPEEMSKQATKKPGKINVEELVKREGVETMVAMGGEDPREARRRPPPKQQQEDPRLADQLKKVQEIRARRKQATDGSKKKRGRKE